MKNAVLLLIFVSLFFAGCDQLKGNKGDTGEQGTTGAQGSTGPSGLINTKTYTGTPTSNPYTVTCPEILDDTASQVIIVYLKKPDNSLIPLPFSVNDKCFEWDITSEGIVSGSTITIDASHYYEVSNKQIILYTSYSNTFSAPYALVDIIQFHYAPRIVTASQQNDYKIEIKTFSSPTSAVAYKNSIRLDTSRYTELLYGKEIN